MTRITLSISDDTPFFPLKIQTADIPLTLKFDSGGGLPYYNGEYSAVPKAWEQTVLQTKNKSMRDNVTVTLIPYGLVDNPSGGQTATIA